VEATGGVSLKQKRTSNQKQPPNVKSKVVSATGSLWDSRRWQPGVDQFSEGELGIGVLLATLSGFYTFFWTLPTADYVKIITCLLPR
jgi:hypothetical protein